MQAYGRQAHLISNAKLVDSPGPLFECTAYLELSARLGMTTGGVLGALDRRRGTSCAAVVGLRLTSSEAARDGAVVGRAVISGDVGRGFPGWLAVVMGLANG